MVLRLARRGPNAGRHFWGCMDYPGCNGTVSTEPDPIPREWEAEEELEATASVIEPRPMNLLAHHPTSRVEVFDSRGWLFGRKKLTSRNWGLEYRRSGRVDWSDVQRAFLSVLGKHLHRGQHVLLDPDVEDYIVKNEASLLLACSTIGLNTFSSDAFHFDSDEERSFWEEMENKIPNLATHACPQFPIEALVNNRVGSGQRVDFLLRTREEIVVIELDGAQHQGAGEKVLDEERDQALRASDRQVIRVPVRGMSDFVQHLDRFELDTEKAVNTPEQIAHVIAVSICEGLKSGALPFNSPGWHIEIHYPSTNGPSTSATLEGFSTQAVRGALQHIKNLMSLFGIAAQSPHQQRLTVGGTRVSFGTAIPRPDPDVSQLHIHFDRIPTGELEQGHFYYRELPTAFPVHRETHDAPSVNLEPQFQPCLYFLKYFFRFRDFREGQWEGLQRTLRGKDTLVLMPTGHGKSAMYQLTALLRPGSCLVIDPIISLMEDQIYNLAVWGITQTVAISSQVTDEKRRAMIDGFSQGQFMFCFVSPERLQIPDFRKALRSLTVHSPVSVIAIDEAHCVSEWGHDFRPAYLSLARVCREFCTSKGRTPPLMGLTGTASRSVLKDVKRELDILDFDAVITPKTFNRPELKFRVETCHSDEKFSRLKGLLQALPAHFNSTWDDFFAFHDNETKSGIIFCPHVGWKFGVVEVSRRVQAELSIGADFYSGQAPKGFGRERWANLKRKTAHRFKENDLRLMVATKAFGMGIDKPNIRYTIHYGIPPSIESFYQEAGRAGRDRHDAICAIIASNDNPRRAVRLLNETTSIREVAEQVEEAGYDEADDITRVLYFQTESFRGVEREMDQIGQILESIGNLESSHTTTIKASNKLKQSEKAIHRLLVIGFVKDYTVDYSQKALNVTINGFFPEEMTEALLRYVSNYQRSRARALRSKLPDPSLAPLDYVKRLCRLLLEFIYDTVELGRRRALLEMTQVCTTEANDDSIRSKICTYLERSEFDDRLEEIIENVESQELVSQIIEDVVSPIHAMALRGRVARFLES